MKKSADVLSDQFIPFPPPDTGCRPVDEGATAVHVYSDNAFADGLHEQADVGCQPQVFLLGLFPLGDVALRAPNRNQAAVLDNTDQVIQKILVAALTISLVGLGIVEAVARLNETAQVFDIGWVGHDQQVVDPATED